MLYFIVLFSVLVTSFAIELDLTVDVAAGKMDCFYQKIKKDTELEIEYQVGTPDHTFFTKRFTHCKFLKI